MNIFEWPKTSLAQHKIYTSAFESYFFAESDYLKTLGSNKSMGLIHF